MDKVLMSLMDSNVRQNRMVADFVIRTAESHEGADLQPLIDNVRASETAYANQVALMKRVKGLTLAAHKDDLERAHEKFTKSVEALGAVGRRSRKRRPT